VAHPAVGLQRREPNVRQATTHQRAQVLTRALPTNLRLTADFDVERSS